MKRSRFQGIVNVLRFNWPFYAMGVVASLVGLTLAALALKGKWQEVAFVLVGLGLLSMIISIIITHFVYDRSGLYSLDWLADSLKQSGYRSHPEHIINLTAGFDETTLLLRQRFPAARVSPVDFYDAARHTEPSIARAQKLYPAPPETRQIQCEQLVQQLDSADIVVAFFSLHEVRNRDERIKCLKQIAQLIGETGRLVLVEHFRDLPNLIAYTFGVLHFHARSTWLQDIHAAHLTISHSATQTPWVNILVLSRELKS